MRRIIGFSRVICKITPETIVKMVHSNILKNCPEYQKEKKIVTLKKTGMEKT